MIRLYRGLLIRKKIDNNYPISCWKSEGYIVCVTLPSGEGYETAKRTLYQSFGKPYTVVKAHIKKLKNQLIKKPDADGLLEFARTLESI